MGPAYNEHDLSYFTQQIDGIAFGGWYRHLGTDAIEVLTVGLMRTVRLDGRLPADAAGQAMEEFVRARKRVGLPIPRAMHVEYPEGDTPTVVCDQLVGGKLGSS